MEYGRIGETLPHGVSKTVHEKLASYQYDLLEVSPDRVESLLREKNFRGLSVADPYRESVLPFLDEISDLARRTGAVDTIVNRDGRLCGYNTEYYGLMELLRLNGTDPAGRKVLIPESGATGRTALAVVHDLGASLIYRVSRTGREGALSCEEMYENHTDAEIIIHTTSRGGDPDMDTASVDLSRFPGLRGVIDVVCDPLRTVLVLEAQKRGIPAMGGLYMQVSQAVRSAELFLDTRFDREVTDRIYQEILNSRRNIVLTGMSMSGKTTLGNLLASRLGRQVIDTDQMVIEKEQTEITTIFAEKGEGYFRDVESEMVRSLAARKGIIIATGGGVILREENVDALKKNGYIVFLDRPLDQILPADDRPLANTRDKVTALFKKRYPTYRSTCDGFIPNDMTPEEGAERILRVLKFKL